MTKYVIRRDPVINRPFKYFNNKRKFFVPLEECTIHDSMTVAELTVILFELKDVKVIPIEVSDG